MILGDHKIMPLIFAVAVIVGIEKEKIKKGK